MGKFDGKQIVGLVGGLIFKAGRNKTTIVQTKSAGVRQTEATKASANLFGIASTFSRTIRYDLLGITSEFYDGGMVNRLTKQNRAIFAQCYDKDTLKFTFNETSFSRLTGFEFNLKSPLVDSLWVEPQVTLLDNELTLNLPVIEIPAELKFPDYANKCKITVFANLYVLDQSLKKSLALQAIEIDKGQANVPAQEFKFEVPDGCLCIIGLNLEYFSLQGNIKTKIKQKTFNPTALCGAIIAPGTFVLPVQTDPHRANNKWQLIPDLKIPC